MKNTPALQGLVATEVKRRVGLGLLGLLGSIATPLLIVVGLAVLTVVGAVAGASSGPPSPEAQQLIPAKMLALYQSDVVKRQCPGLSWTVVAAITHLESNDNRNPGPSSVGALGASQFIPTTWDARGRHVVNVGKPYGKITTGGYGLDGDGDGKADILNPSDSVPATARMLCANGGGNPKTLPAAIFSYNHAWWYVNGGTNDSGVYFQGVLPLAKRLATIGTGSPGMASVSVQAAVQFAASQIGKPYIWGAQSPSVGFDCSGLVLWAFNQAGFGFSDTTAAGEYNWGIHVTRDQLQYGDLVFWATPSGYIHHVAIYLGQARDEIIAAPHTGALVRVQPMYYDGFIGGVRVVAPAAK